MVADLELKHDPALESGTAQLIPQWIRLGENVGYGGDSVAGLHQKFMDSPRHRENILNPGFTLAGVGVVWESGRMWVTVKFASASGPVPTVLRTPVERLSRTDNSRTSVALSMRRPPSSSPFVVIARDDDFADALTGGALAAIEGAPLLLSPRESIGEGLVEEARRVLAPGGVVQLLGGDLALSPAVALAFAQAGLVTERLAGPDRFATAAAVAARVEPIPSTVIVVSGVSFPDATSASAPAGLLRAPILLVAADTVPASTAAFLSVARPVRRVAIGGTAAVGHAAATTVGVTERVAGPDRFATSAAVAKRFLPSATAVTVATGLEFQDALMVGPEAARMSAPVVLTASGVPPATYDAVAAVNPRWRRALVVGDTSAIPASDMTLFFT